MDNFNHTITLNHHNEDTMEMIDNELNEFFFDNHYTQTRNVLDHLN